MIKQKKETGKKVATAKRPPPVKNDSKLGQLEAMLRRPDGATLAQLSKALAWQPHLTCAARCREP